MDERTFGELIDQSQASLTDLNNIVEQSKVLINLLKNLPEAEIIEFEKIFTNQQAACYSWKNWAVPYLAFEGCSDDAFGSFTAWMISKGKKLFLAMLSDSSILAAEVKKTLPSWISIGESEEFFLAPARAYNLKTGRELTDDMPDSAYDEIRTYLSNPRGEKFSDATICKLYPDVGRHFSTDWLLAQ